MTDDRDPQSSVDPFDDPELGATARQVQAALETPPVDPEFRRQLHARVVAERARVIGSKQHRPWWRRLLATPRSGMMRTLAPALAVLLIGCLMLAGAVFLPRLGRPGTVAVAMTGAAGTDLEGASQALVVHFSQPMDRASVAAALQIAPATSVHLGWRGDDLVVTPAHGFAPNVPYVLTVDGARARTASGADLAGSPQLAFGSGSTVSSGPGLGPAGQTATAFAAAQLAGDVASMRAQAAPGVHLPDVSSLSRVWVVNVASVSATSSRASVELLVDGGPDHAQPVIATETLVLQPNASGRLVVAAVSVGHFQDFGNGPRIMHIGLGSGGRTVQVTYDCDMDVASIAGANRMTDAAGQTIPISTSYDAATRTVTVRLPASVHGTVDLSVTRGLRDIDGQNLAVPFQTTLQVGSDG